jgi:hypothetical protein
MMQRLEPFINDIGERVSNRFPDGKNTAGEDATVDDMWAALDELKPDLLEFGLAEADLELLRDALNTHVDMGNIRGPRDFVEMLGQALSMVAYGVPEMMDPMESMWMGVQAHIKPMQDQLIE